MTQSDARQEFVSRKKTRLSRLQAGI